MHTLRRSLALTAALTLSSVASAAITLVDSQNWKATLGGFIEVDSFHDSSRSFSEVMGNLPVARPGSAGATGPRYQMSVRNSRLSFDLNAPPVDEWNTRAFLELDFLGFDPEPGALNSETGFVTNPTTRVRHAYLSATRHGWQLLAGQFWNLFAWQPYYVPTTVAVPVAGVAYARNPQLRVVKDWSFGETSMLQTGLALVRPLQRDAGVPNLDIGLRFSSPSRLGAHTFAGRNREAEPLSIALSGTVRDISLPRGASDHTHLVGWAGAADVLVPLFAADAQDVSNSLTLTAEGTLGEGYGEQFPGWSGNMPALSTADSGGTHPNLDAGSGGFDSSAGFHIAKLQTWNLTLQYHFPQGWDTFVNLTAGQIYSESLRVINAAAGRVAYDLVEVYCASFFHDFTPQLRVGAEYAHSRTRYLDGLKTHNDRIQVSAWFRI